VEVSFIIHAKSQRGFWNNEIGWVRDAASATVFPCTTFNFPCIGVDDCEWLPVAYED
jgi:hypothetical protein